MDLVFKVSADSENRGLRKGRVELYIAKSLTELELLERRRIFAIGPLYKFRLARKQARMLKRAKVHIDGRTIHQIL